MLGKVIALICGVEIETGHCITTTGQESRAEQRRGEERRGSQLTVVEFSWPSLTLSTTNGRNRSQHELFAVEIFGLFSSAPPTHAAVAVGRVGVGTAVDRGTSCRQILPSPLGHEDHDGHHDRRHQDEAGDGDTNGKAPL